MNYKTFKTNVNTMIDNGDFNHGSKISTRATRLLYVLDQSKKLNDALLAAACENFTADELEEYGYLAESNVFDSICSNDVIRVADIVPCYESSMYGFLDRD